MKKFNFSWILFLILSLLMLVGCQGGGAVTVSFEPGYVLASDDAGNSVIVKVADVNPGSDTCMVCHGVSEPGAHRINTLPDSVSYRFASAGIKREGGEGAGHPWAWSGGCLKL